ncbi:MAG TPA: histidine phosphatase family protein [Gammaproteobacteria bacterium]|nr:histidine phosphatase family protein [Gammaproteobacteria bacterium]
MDRIMTTFLLIRHAHHDMVGKAIAGRMSGVTLTPEGESQAEYLAEQMAMMPIDRIYSSPRERTQATAAAIAGFLDLEVQTCAGLDEIEFGEWQGRTFEDLEDDPAWRRFNRFRSGARTAGGEFMLQVQVRMVSVLEDLRTRFPGEVIALVSHSDPIKATIACYAGISLDLMLRIEISPASISIISLDDYGPYILCVNQTGRSPRVT